MESVCVHMQDREARAKFWRESLTLSMESLQKNILRFENAVTAADPNELAEVAHKIVGTISFVGVKDLSERLLNLQEQCEEGIVTFPLSDSQNIQKTLHEIVDELATARDNPPD